MRRFLLLLVSLIFVLHSSLLAAAPMHTCCKNADCPMTQCVVADCLPSAMPAALGKIDVPALPAISAAAQSPAPTMLPTPAADIWCPPD
jgi:hypothetical protein